MFSAEWMRENKDMDTFQAVLISGGIFALRFEFRAYFFFLRHFCDDINNNYFSALNQIKLKELWVCYHFFPLRNHNRIQSFIFRLDWYLRGDMASL